MSIQFEEEQFNNLNRQTHFNQPKGFVGLVIKMGLAKNAQQANLVLIGFIFILILISFFSLRSMQPNEAVQVPVDENFDPETGMPYENY